MAAAEADTQASLAEFDGIVLRALEETETALTSYARALEQRQALRAARDQAERAARIVRAKRQEGASDSLEWLDAERTFAETAEVLAAQDGQISPRPIALFRAPAGGRRWEEGWVGKEGVSWVRFWWVPAD